MDDIAETNRACLDPCLNYMDLVDLLAITLSKSHAPYSYLSIVFIISGAVVQSLRITN